MTNFLKTLAVVALVASTGPLAAQETTTETPAETPADGTTTEDGAATDPLDLSMGTDASEDLGAVYVAEVFTDWELRCVRTEQEQDPCQLYQLLKDSGGNAVAEINLFVLPEGGEATAGATVVTPLETLLTQQLSLKVDGGSVRRYPFSWCAQMGCFARVGFTDAEIDQFKRGVKATLTIVPVTAPDQRVDLDMSLKGFTAAFTALSAMEN